MFDVPHFVHPIFTMFTLIIYSASATISDNMATVTITGLACEQTFSIVAGAIITSNVTMETMLDGPRFQGNPYIASSCSMTPTPTTSIGKRVLRVFLFTCNWHLIHAKSLTCMLRNHSLF